MNIFTKPCSKCRGTVLGPRLDGRACGEWLGHDECLSCRADEIAHLKDAEDRRISAWAGERRGVGE